MYYLSKLTGNYYNSEFVEVPKDDSNQLYLDMIESGNIEIVESLEFEIDAIKLKEKKDKAISIDLEYTEKIDNLMMKHHNKVIQSIYFNTTYVIPQIALDEMQALKDECNAKITDLGITDFSYRQSVPKLAKILTINK